MTLHRRAKRILPAALIPVFVAVCPVFVLADDWDVLSPNGKVSLTVSLGTPAAADYPRDKPRLYYRVEHGTGTGKAVVIPDSPLGLSLEGQDLVDGLAFVSVDGPRKIEEQYTAPHGKRRECRNTANALTLKFRNTAGALMELELRAYDDGAAFQYGLPEEAREARTLKAEITGFAMPADARLWMQPHDKVTDYAPAYETFYENGIAVGKAPATEVGWSLPVLLRTADEKHWGLIVDAAVGPDDYGVHLTAAATGGVYRVALPDPTEGLGYGAALPQLKGPWKSAWRAIILGDSPGAIVESTLTDDLNPPTAMQQTDWVRPGRVAWSWYSDPPSPQDAQKQLRFVDFAAEMGWEYVLVDANWTIIDKGTIHDILRHAKSKNVGVLLWYNSGGPINIVTEKPRDSLFFPQVRRHELEMLKRWGVKGIKVDFFQSDKPEVMALYHDILKDAAKSQVMISFHGCTMPRGWSRTYPHLITMEAVRGEETYLFEDSFPDVAPVQNTILPFTRNAVGPMDYTPVGLNSKPIAHKTTFAHEVALTVVFESGWLCFADDPDAYRALPDAARQFLKDVPVAWDQTRFVAGYPGRSVVLARQKGKDWYIAGVNGLKEAQKLTIDLKKFLPQGSYRMNLVSDGKDARQFGGQSRNVTAGDSIEVQMLPYGGFVAQFKAAP